MGTEDECRQVAGRLASIVEVLEVSEPLANRGASRMIHIVLEGDCVPGGRLNFPYATIPPPGALIQHGESRWMVAIEPPRIDVAQNGVTFTFLRVHPATETGEISCD